MEIWSNMESSKYWFLLQRIKNDLQDNVLFNAFRIRFLIAIFASSLNVAETKWIEAAVLNHSSEVNMEKRLKFKKQFYFR